MRVLWSRFIQAVERHFILILFLMFQFETKQIETLTGPGAGDAFRQRIENGRLIPLIGVYDVFSALIASKIFEGVFCSGYSYAASAYGLPDVGYVNWRDMIDWATKVRHALPNTHTLVDVDDGFGDQIVATNTVRNLEANGLSAVMMEDQKRPRRCGHFEGKEILPLPSGAIHRPLPAGLGRRQFLHPPKWRRHCSPCSGL